MAKSLSRAQPIRRLVSDSICFRVFQYGQTVGWLYIYIYIWKARYRHHTKSFDNPGYKGETVLSTHIWELKARGSTYEVSWKVIDRGSPFTPVTGQCSLCTKEKFYILRRPDLASLNKRQEVGAHCRHIAMSLIPNVAKVKVP